LKKPITIALLIIYLFSATELHEVLKLPILIEHYLEHKAQNNQLSLLDFLALHYNQSFDHDKNDHKLPFKSKECNTSANVLAHFEPALTFIAIKQADFTIKIYSVFYKVPFTSAGFSKIWQPPKI
jgi:hypothetical protein